MGRPSLKEQRSIEILDAFARCVARNGLDGTTLEFIAAEANVKRSLLRHYLGNRNQMTVQLTQHVMNRFDGLIRQLVHDLPSDLQSEAVLNRLFSHRTHSPVDAAVYQSLVAAAHRHPEVKQPLTAFLNAFEKALCRVFAAEYPEQSRSECRTVAAGISAIYFNFDANLPLKPGPSWLRRQKQAAFRLLATLAD